MRLFRLEAAFLIEPDSAQLDGGIYVITPRVESEESVGMGPGGDEVQRARRK